MSQSNESDIVEKHIDYVEWLCSADGRVKMEEAMRRLKPQMIEELGRETYDAMMRHMCKYEIE